MAYAEQWSTDPADNNKNPPLGAGEFKMPHDRITDTFRVVMAGIREVYDRTLAAAPDATKFGGRTRQQAYDDIWPVGSERDWHSTNLAGLVPSGISATWTRVAQDCLIVGAGSTYSVGTTTGTGTAATAEEIGAHDHGGNTHGRVLTSSNLGSNLDAQTVREGEGVERRLVRVNPEVVGTSPFSGATAHDHSIADDGAHTHTITLPKRYAAVRVRRTA